MKKIFILVLFFMSAALIGLNANASSIDVPADEEYYTSVSEMPLPSNTLLGNLKLSKTILLSGNSTIGEYCNVYTSDISLFVPMAISESNGLLVNYPVGSSMTFTYNETKCDEISVSEKVSTTLSTSISSTLSAKLGFSGDEIESSFTATVSETIGTETGTNFTYSLATTVSDTMTFNIIEGGKYRLEKRFFTKAYVLQYYVRVKSTTTLFALPSTNYRYYYRGYDLELSYNNTDTGEILLAKYLDGEELGQYVFDKEYYMRAFGVTNDNFIAL